MSPGTSATTKLRSSLERDDAEIRRERRERVVGDLRTRRRDARDQRRLAGVRESDQSDVGQQLQLQPEEPFFAGLARLGPPRRAVGGRDEARVAAAAAAALARRARAGPPRSRSASRSRLAVARRFLEDQRADRHVDLEIVGRVAGAVRALPVLAAARP